MNDDNWHSNGASVCGFRYDLLSEVRIACFRRGLDVADINVERFAICAQLATDPKSWEYLKRLSAELDVKAAEEAVLAANKRLESATARLNELGGDGG